MNCAAPPRSYREWFGGVLYNERLLGVKQIPCPMDETYPNPSVRTATASDAAGCARIYAPLVRDAATSFETTVPGETDFERRIAETLAFYPWLVCDRGGDVAGYAYAREHRARRAYRWCTEVSVYVSPEHQRLGLGAALYKKLLECLTAQRLRNAYAGIALPNPASVAFHEAFGFDLVGVYNDIGYKLGKWHDVGWWALRLPGTDGEPDEPLPFSKIAEDCGLQPPMV
jgi:L-amino acid N-acyltransferase YncA